MRSKRASADADKAVYSIIGAFMIFAMLTVFVFTVFTHRDALLEPSEKLEASFLAERFTHSKDCFTYQDPITKQVSPYVIDLTKFTKERLESSCFTQIKQQHPQFRVRLQQKNLDISTSFYTNVEDVVLRKKVLIKDGSALKQDTLLIYLQKEGRA